MKNFLILTVLFLSLHAYSDDSYRYIKKVRTENGFLATTKISNTHKSKIIIVTICQKTPGRADRKFDEFIRYGSFWQRTAHHRTYFFVVKSKYL